MIVVLGSINMDLVAVTDEIPKVGETVIGKRLIQNPGGKGANQAVCAARLDSKVVFLGKVGNDTYGRLMLQAMHDSGVDISSIEKSKKSTGIAVISVDSKGQNNIIVIPGANGDVDCDYIDRQVEFIEKCEIILAQHETPAKTTEYAFEIAKKKGKLTILNPAPADELSEKLISLTDILVPNENELARISGVAVNTEIGIRKSAKVLINRGIKLIIVTLGAKGVLLIDQNGEKRYPANLVKAVDTTAAGDSFLGAFAASYSREKDIDKAIIFGQLVASYTVRYSGAQSSMPSKKQLEDTIDSQYLGKD